MIPLRDMIGSRRFPIVTVSLIVLNLLVFLFQGYLDRLPPLSGDWTAERLEWIDQGLQEPPILDPRYSVQRQSRFLQQSLEVEIPRGEWFLTQYALIPSELLGGQDLPPRISLPLWATLITSIFLHGGIMHVVGNMLYLWIFGDNVEDAMGPIRFLIFYLLCGLAAAFAQIAVGPGSSIPMVGASGAIAGVLAAYFMLYPHNRILTLVPLFFFLRLVSLPAVFLLGFWFVLQLINGAGSVGGGGGVAYFAHIGGFVAGLLLVFPFRDRRIPVTLWRMVRRRLTPR